jgi:hypothetical protein
MRHLLRFLLFLRPGAQAGGERERNVRWVGSNYKKSLSFFSIPLLPGLCPGAFMPRRGSAGP